MSGKIKSIEHLINMKFGRLTVLKDIGKNKYSQKLVEVQYC